MCQALAMQEFCHLQHLHQRALASCLPPHSGEHDMCKWQQKMIQCNFTSAYVVHRLNKALVHGLSAEILLQLHLLLHGWRVIS